MQHYLHLYFIFGGPKINGSLRDIRLIRDGKKTAVIDFYNYLNSGIRKDDFKLLRNDVIFIPPRGKTIKVAIEIFEGYL